MDWSPSSGPPSALASTPEPCQGVTAWPNDLKASALALWEAGAQREEKLLIAPLRKKKRRKKDCCDEVVLHPVCTETGWKEGGIGSGPEGCPGVQP